MIWVTVPVMTLPPMNLPFIGSSLKNCGNETVVCDSISWESIEQLLCI